MLNYSIAASILTLCACGDFPDSRQTSRKSIPSNEASLSDVKTTQEESVFQQLLLLGQSEEKKFPCRAEYKIQGDDIIIKVIVKNNSGNDVIFVDHPDHTSVSILAENRDKDEAVDISLITYAPAQMDRVKRIKNGEEMVFTKWIQFKKESSGVLKVYHNIEGYMRIWDKKLTVDFTYGWYPDYLPKGMSAKDRKTCVKESIAAKFSMTSSQITN